MQQSGTNLGAYWARAEHSLRERHKQPLLRSDFPPYQRIRSGPYPCTQSHYVIVLAASGQFPMAASGQIPVAVNTRAPARRTGSPPHRTEDGTSSARRAGAADAHRPEDVGTGSGRRTEPRTGTGSAGAPGPRTRTSSPRRPDDAGSSPARQLAAAPSARTEDGHQLGKAGRAADGHQARGRAPGPRTGTGPAGAAGRRRRGGPAMGPRNHTSSPPPHRAKDGHRGPRMGTIAASGNVCPPAGQDCWATRPATDARDSLASSRRLPLVQPARQATTQCCPGRPWP